MIKVENLTKVFTTNLFFKSKFAAVNNVSFSIDEGETLGLIGESGCGKSTLAKIILRLMPANSGKVIFNGTDILNLKHKELQNLRSKMQIMFQHPESSLNPRMKVYDSIAELMRIHKVAAKRSKEEVEKVQELINWVGLKEEHLKRYPMELSGGQIQRAVLARVLSVQPKLLIADEPTSMLDVSVQAQILNLLKDMQKKFRFSCLFISHDLDVISVMSKKTAVMYKGTIVEMGATEKILNNPLHPYTIKLVSQFNYSETSKKHKVMKEVASTNLHEDKYNCCFQDCCSWRNDNCSKITELKEVEREHFVACWNINHFIDRSEKGAITEII